ncbi:TolC family protein [Halothiobacillus sp. DCM-1]|uniref:TolC family protein n=1 Tax=Halothiobacillus sp. DCM-1 TaxID=3112558 RepID=UPI00324633C5
MLHPDDLDERLPRPHHRWIRPDGRLGRLLALGGLLLALGGCASYQPLPPTAEQAPVAVPPHQAWTLASATAFALQHNPNLRESTLQLTLARQQAGLAQVPPPLGLGFSLDHPWQQGLFNAFSLSASQDLSFWLQRAPRDARIRATLRQAILNQRWQAWQLVAAVQQQYVSLWTFSAQQRLLDTQIDWARQRRAEAQPARAAGLITADAEALLDARLAEWQQAAATLEQQQRKARVAFNQLLGVAADADTPLDPPPSPPSGVPPQPVELDQLPQRPDLLALHAAIDEQDAQYRQALLDQFPAISLGLTRSQDTSKVQTLGLGIQLVIPLFDGNRHAIAVADTRRALAAEQYRNRLAHARAEVIALQQKQAALQRNRVEIEQHLRALRPTLAHAEQAMTAGLMSASSVDALRQALFAQQTALLENTAEQQRAAYALPALAGIAPAGLPPAAAADAPSPHP